MCALSYLTRCPESPGALLGPLSTLSPGSWGAKGGGWGPRTPRGRHAVNQPERTPWLPTYHSDHPSKHALQGSGGTPEDLLPTSAVVLLQLWSLPPHSQEMGREASATGWVLSSSPGPRAQRAFSPLVEKCLFFSFLTSLLRGYQTNMDWKKGEGDAFPYFVYGASCSEVEVDCLTGAHKVKSDISVHHIHKHCFLCYKDSPSGRTRDRYIIWVQICFK